ncbi:MAG: ABC transporter ATP-binding protein [Syntrophales bacterium LBB04]|nr:ABC transporter ATP-binding protein [Syntrophales bacterium LBB04]
MNSEKSILEAKNLQVRRGGVSVLDIAYLGVPEGKVLCLIGPNGAGKSSLLLALSCLLKLFQGEIIFRGKGVGSNYSVFDYRRNIAMVFQEPLLFDTTVFENVAAGLKIRGMRQDQITLLVEEYLERFGISHLVARSAKKLSGGEAQRTSLARAFAVRPQIIFLDEPFSSLDPPTRESLMEDLERIFRETRTTGIMATHDQMEALRLSDQIAVMNEGKIVQTGSPVEVMNHPVDEFVASFVGTETILTGKVIRRNAGTFSVSVAERVIEAVGDASSGESVILCIRPENVTVSTGSSKEITSARNVFSSVVKRIIPSGAFYKVELDCGFHLVAYVTNLAREDLSMHEGMDLTASFKATAIHVIRKKFLRSSGE